MSRQSLCNRIGSFLLLCGERGFDGDRKYWSTTELWKGMACHSIIDPQITIDNFCQLLGRQARIGAIGRTAWDKSLFYYFKNNFNAYLARNFGSNQHMNIAMCLGTYQDSNIPAKLETINASNNTNNTTDTSVITAADTNTTLLLQQQNLPNGYLLVGSEQLSWFVY